jgi:SAM-dependent methyltransferase
MVRYMMAAGALKMFSATTHTKQFYRYIGNTYGAKKRANAGLPKPYVDRAKEIIAKVRKYGGLKPGARLLELGTGWLHWESTILRLFYDVEVHLFDVWDNRQFPAFRSYFRDFAAIVDSLIPMTPEEKARVHSLLDKLLQLNTFDEVYALLGHKYVLHPEGSLAAFPDNYFDLIFSSSVLEHVDERIIPEFMKGNLRVLKPGGLAMHLVDLGDHLTLYDSTMPYNKNYLRYSHAVWRTFFQNDVQYFNRIQRPQWLKYFADAGFQLVEERSEPIDLNGFKVSSSFSQFDRNDLACLTLHVVHTKPK